MEESPELKEITAFKQVDFRKDKKRKKRLKFSIILLSLFLIIIIIFLAKRIDFSIIFNLKPASKKMVNPQADSFFEEKILRALKDLNLKPESIYSLNERDIEVILSDGLKILLSRSKDLTLTLTSLQLITERFRIEGRRVKKIDLRFKNPIIE